MNVLTTLKENRFNDITMDVDTISIISPCMLRARIVNMKYKMKSDNTFNKLPFRCILKSIRLGSIIKISGIQSLRVTAEANDYRIAESNEVFRLPQITRICIIELERPLTDKQITDVIEHTDSLTYNKEYSSLYF